MSPRKQTRKHLPPKIHQTQPKYRLCTNTSCIANFKPKSHDNKTIRRWRLFFSDQSDRQFRRETRYHQHVFVQYSVLKYMYRIPTMSNARVVPRSSTPSHTLVIITWLWQPERQSKLVQRNKFPLCGEELCEMTELQNMEKKRTNPLKYKKVA